MFFASTNSDLSGTDWPNGGLFVYVNKSECCLTSPLSKITGQAHLAVTNGYSVNSWPQVLMQKRCSEGANVKWVELGRINCCSVRSWQQSQSIKSANLVSFKSSVFPVMAHWQMHNGEDYPGQLCPTGNQGFVQEVTKKDRTSEPVQGNRAFTVNQWDHWHIKDHVNASIFLLYIFCMATTDNTFVITELLDLQYDYSVIQQLW